MASDPGQIRLRLDKKDIARIDRYATHLQTLTGLEYSRTHSVLSLMELGLIAFESGKRKKDKALLP
jgi:hypothetical protein